MCGQGKMPQVDVAGLDAHRDYLLIKKRDDPSLGRNQLCVLLATDRKVYCSLNNMRKWLRRQQSSPSSGPSTITDVNGLKPYESYLRGLLAIGAKDKAMIGRLSIDHHVVCQRKSMRSWIAAELAAPGQEHLSFY